MGFNFGLCKVFETSLSKDVSKMKVISLWRVQLLSDIWFLDKNLNSLKKLVPNFILVSKTINGHSVKLGHHLLRKRLFHCLSDLHFLHCRERDNHQKGAGTWKKAEWYNKMQFDELQWPYLLHSYIFFNR